MKYASFTRLQVRTTVSFILLFVGLFSTVLKAQQKIYVPGVARTGVYYEQITGKRIAVVANKTSLLPNGTHTVDHLISLGARIQEVWAPEHGFRGDKDAGEHISDERDPKTGLPIRSLYGKNKRPSKDWLKEIDLVIYDIQDVGTRFYTYSTTLSYVLDACVESAVPLMVMDRGNPNGHYVDGPILEPGFESMVGLHPIPIVHGLTMGEYANMVYGERWMPFLTNESSRKLFEQVGGLTIVPCVGYDHHTVFEVFQIMPSPNLRSVDAIWHYPSLCFFEGTSISCGRGTPEPFTHFGAPWLKAEQFQYQFTPQPDFGSKYPKHQGDICFGRDLTKKIYTKIDWEPIFSTYEFWQGLPQTGKVEFFNNFFEKLAGTDKLRNHLQGAKSIEQWYASYHDEAFREYVLTRQKYLLYAM